VTPVATFFAVMSAFTGALPRSVASADCAQVTVGAARIDAIAAPIKERGR